MAMNFKNKCALNYLLFFFCFFVGCSSDDASDVKPPEVSEGELYGVVHDAPVSGAAIQIYPFSVDVSDELTTSSEVTSDSGFYSIDSIQMVDQAILVNSKGGQYLDEVSTRQIALPKEAMLRAALLYENEEETEANITLLTTISACLAQFYLRDGDNPEDAIIKANQLMSDFSSFDIVKTTPLDITKQKDDASLSDSVRYGFMLSAVSSMVAELAERDNQPIGVGPYQPHLFADIACQDILADGYLNGKGKVTDDNENGQLKFGETLLDTESYRKNWAEHILKVANNENVNRLNIIPSDLYFFANNLSNSENRIFGGLAGGDVDTQGPSIDPLTPTGSLLSGQVNLEFHIEDPTGLQFTNVFINNAFHSQGNAVNTIVEFDSRIYPDGELTLRLEAGDVVGNQSAQEFVYNVDNDSLLFNLVNGHGDSLEGYLTNQDSVLVGVEPISHSNGIVITQVEINGVTARLDSETGLWLSEIDLSNGINEVVARVTDSRDIVTSISGVVQADHVPPVVESIDMPVSISRGLGLNNCEVQQINSRHSSEASLCLSTYRLSLGNAQFDPLVFSNQGYIVLAMDIDDQENSIQNVFTSVDNLQVEYKVEKNREMIRDWGNLLRYEHLPSDKIYLPITHEFLTDTFHLSSKDDVFDIDIRVTDEAGNHSQLRYSLSLDVMPPQVVLEPLLDMEFPVDYARRGVLAENYSTSYLYQWVNGSSDIELSINDMGLGSLIRRYQGAHREHFVQEVEQEHWRARLFRSRNVSIDANNHIDFTFFINDEYIEGAINESDDKPIFHFMPTSSARMFPDVRVSDERVQIFTDDLTEVNSSLTMINQAQQWSDLNTERDCRFRSFSFYSAGHTDIDYFLYQSFAILRAPSEGGGVLGYGCTKAYAGNGYTGEEVYSDVQGRVQYHFISSEGYPRNVVMSYEDPAISILPSVRIVNTTFNNLEIMPEEGIYRIPANASIRIELNYDLPNLTLFSDERVLDLNNETVPYRQSGGERSEVYLDDEWRFIFDTSLDLSMKIPLDEVSITNSSFGTEDEYSISRMTE